MKWPWRGPAISRHFNTAIIKKTTTVLSAVVVLVSLSGAALADQFDAQIAAARQAAAAAQAQASASSAQASNYQDQVNQYQSQANVIQAQINLNVAKSNKLDVDIATAIANLAEQKTILSASIKQMYLDSGVTPLEMLASSQNISDFMNKQQYQDKVKTKIQDSMASILALKAQLDAQQKEVAQILITEHSQRDQVASLLGQANALLAVAQQSAAAANQQVKQQNSQISGLIAARAAAVSSGSLHVSGGGCGPYPDNWCSAGQDSMDTLGGYPNRECTSYAAWRWSQSGHPIPAYWGDGGAWMSEANSSVPHPGDIIVWARNANAYIGYHGHVGFVESVSGSTVTWSQYNFNTGSGDGRYSIMSANLGSAVLVNTAYVH